MARESDRVRSSGALSSSAAAIGSGLGKSLSDLSNMYGKQAAEELAAKQLEENKVESARRFGIQQNRLDANAAESARRFQVGQDENANKLQANKDTNDWLAKVKEGTTKFSGDAYSKEIREHYEGASKRANEAKSATAAYLSGNGSEESLKSALSYMTEMIPVDKTGQTSAAERILERKANLIAYRDELLGENYKDKDARIAALTESMYKPITDAIDSERESGKALLKKQKVEYIMRSMPESTRRYGNYDTIAKSVEGMLTGPTEKRLLDTEDARVAAVDRQILASQKSSYKASGRGSNKAGYEKVMDILSFEGVNDIGPTDNDNVRNAVEVMMRDGIDEQSIAMAIQLGKTSSWYGDNKFPKPRSTAAKKLHTTASMMSTRGKTNANPFLRQSAVARGLPELQLNLARSGIEVNLGVVPTLERYRAKKQEEVAVLASSPDSLPTPTPINAITPVYETGVRSADVPTMDMFNQGDEDTKSRRTIPAKPYTESNPLNDIGTFLSNAVTGVRNLRMPDFDVKTNLGSDEPNVRERESLRYRFSNRGYELENKGKRRSDMSVNPRPVIKHGSDAVKAVESVEGSLGDVEKMILMDEGYSNDVYLDTKGNRTTGVGQTGDFMNVGFKEAFRVKRSASKRIVPELDSLPLGIQYSVIQAVYRGDVNKNHKWIKAINSGDFAEAAKELLNHREYRDLKRKGIDNSITRRMEKSHRLIMENA